MDMTGKVQNTHSTTLADVKQSKFRQELESTTRSNGLPKTTVPIRAFSSTTYGLIVPFIFLSNTIRTIVDNRNLHY